MSLGLSFFDLGFISCAAGGSCVVVNPIAALYPNSGYDSFECAQSIGAMEYGSGWTGTWFVRRGELGLQDSEPWQTYPLGSGVSGLAGGERWTGAWTIGPNPTGLAGRDDFEAASVGADVSGLASGSGWSGSWIVATNSV